MAAKKSTRKSTARKAAAKTTRKKATRKTARKRASTSSPDVVYSDLRHDAVAWALSKLR